MVLSGIEQASGLGLELGLGLWVRVSVAGRVRVRVRVGLASTFCVQVRVPTSVADVITPDPRAENAITVSVECF